LRLVTPTTDDDLADDLFGRLLVAVHDHHLVPGGNVDDLWFGRLSPGLGDFDVTVGVDLGDLHGVTVGGETVQEPHTQRHGGDGNGIAVDLHLAAMVTVLRLRLGRRGGDDDEEAENDEELSHGTAPLSFFSVRKSY